ncbi:MAG: hypothetical protein WA687_13535 [Solirubrobacterales bacterium]
MGSESGSLLADRDWRHRRVDSLTVTDTLNVRTQTSVDFSIPLSAPEFRLDDADGKGAGDGGLEGQALFYLPVAVLSKWPPLANFDLRDDSGRCLPLLTKQRNREVDAAALAALVPGPCTHLRAELLKALTAVVESGPQQAPLHLRRFMELLLPILPAAPPPERIMWALVKGWASVLSNNSLLWVPVIGCRGDRHVVKFAFEQYLDGSLHFWKRVEQSFSFAPVISSISIPQVAAVRSYHLQFEAPRDLEVVSASLQLGAGPPSRIPGANSPQPASPGLVESMPRLSRRFLRWFSRLLHSAADAAGAGLREYLDSATEYENAPRRGRRSDDEPKRGEPYKRITSRRAHLYVSEPARGLPVGVIQIGIRAARVGIITGSFIASVLIAIVMSVYAIAASTITDEHLPAAVTVLVLVPGLIGYLAVRPNEHPLLRRSVRSVRLLLLLAASVPISAAVLLVAIGNGEAVQWTWAGLTFLSWMLAGLLAISWLLPPGRSPDEL